MIQATSDRKFHNTLKYGMVGGGPGSLIGSVHRTAISLDGKASLVAGCFSRDYEKTLKTGKQLGLDEDRLYENYEEMAQQEAQRDSSIDFVSITTPNVSHYEIARAFLEKGISVVCDKPLTTQVDQAEELADLVKDNDVLFCVTYTYSGYPMVKEAKALIDRGEIGEVRVVQAEYPQEWLATPAEKEGVKQAEWRTDPSSSGVSNCVGDIGSHIENTVSYMTGLRIDSLSANLDIFVEGRKLDDNAEILVKFDTGATGMYWSSQVAIGYDNALTVRIFGTEGTIEWRQENPNYLQLYALDKPAQTLSRGRDHKAPSADRVTELPAGHPEGYFEAFANVYSGFTSTLRDKKAGKQVEESSYDYPPVDAGLQGVKFIHSCVNSSQSNSRWVQLD